MAILRVSGLGALDGEYDANITAFTNRELRLIKQETGLRAGEIEEAMAARDNDLSVAIAMIVLQRAGKGNAAGFKDILWDADVGSMVIDLTDEDEAARAEDDALPPASAPTGRSEPNSEAPTSGNSSSNGSDSPESNLPAIGIQA